MSAQTLLGLVCGQRQGAWPLCAAPPPRFPPPPPHPGAANIPHPQTVKLLWPLPWAVCCLHPSFHPSLHPRDILSN